MNDNAECNKKIKDYIYSLYKRNLITFQQYVHKLKLIEDEEYVEVNEVSNYLIYFECIWLILTKR